MYSLNKLKIRTIHEAYYTLPDGFKDLVLWEDMKDNLERDTKEDDIHIVKTVRQPEFSITEADRINMEFVASVVECTSTPDLIQLTAIHVLATIRLANKF